LTAQSYGGTFWGHGFRGIPMPKKLVEIRWPLHYEAAGHNNRALHRRHVRQGAANRAAKQMVR